MLVLIGLALLAAPQVNNSPVKNDDILAAAEAQYRNGEFAGALSTLDTLPAVQQDSVSVLALRARSLFAKGDASSGLAIVRQLLSKKDRSGEAQFEAGAILRETATARFEQLLAIAPESAEVHEMAGRQHEASNRLPQALAEYRSALDRQKDRPGLHYLIGNVLWKLNEPDEALQEFAAELARNPNHALANLRQGQVLLQKNEIDQAITSLQAAAKGSPDLAVARRELARALRAASRDQEALTHLKEAATLAPRDEEIRVQLAQTYRRLGDEANASREFEAYRRLVAAKKEARDRFSPAR